MTRLREGGEEEVCPNPRIPLPPSPSARKAVRRGQRSTSGKVPSLTSLAAPGRGGRDGGGGHLLRGAAIPQHGSSAPSCWQPPPGAFRHHHHHHPEEKRPPVRGDQQTRGSCDLDDKPGGATYLHKHTHTRTLSPPLASPRPVKQVPTAGAQTESLPVRIPPHPGTNSTDLIGFCFVGQELKPVRYLLISVQGN